MTDLDAEFGEKCELPTADAACPEPQLEAESACRERRKEYDDLIDRLLNVLSRGFDDIDSFLNQLHMERRRNEFSVRLSVFIQRY